MNPGGSSKQLYNQSNQSNPSNLDHSSYEKSMSREITQSNYLNIKSELFIKELQKQTDQFADYIKKIQDDVIKA